LIAFSTIDLPKDGFFRKYEESELLQI